MTSILKNTTWAITLVLLLLTGCKKNETSVATTKNVVYEVKRNNAESEDTEFILRASYVNENGEESGSRSYEIPWRYEMKNARAEVKHKFSGFIEYIAQSPSSLDFTVTMTVFDAQTGKSLYQNKKVVKSAKATAEDPTFSKEEVRAKTTFLFEE